MCNSITSRVYFKTFIIFHRIAVHFVGSFLGQRQLKRFFVRVNTVQGSFQYNSAVVNFFFWRLEFFSRAYCRTCAQVLSNDESFSCIIETSWACFLCRYDKWASVVRMEWRKNFLAIIFGEQYAAQIISNNVIRKSKLRMFSTFDGIATGLLNDS